MANQVTLSQFFVYVENLPWVLKKYKIKQSEAAFVLGWSREYLNRKLKNPYSWKLGELNNLQFYIETAIKLREENQAMLGSNLRK